MRPKKPENKEPQLELLKTRLESFINLEHPLAKMGREIKWEEFDQEFGGTFHPKKGRPGLSTRLMVGLTYLKYTYDLSDEECIERFVSDPYWQYFCGFEYFQYEFPCDDSSMTRWRHRLGDKGAEKLLVETLATAHQMGLLKKQECERVIVDTTVQEKNITHPTDSKLINKVREKLVKLAKERGIELRQSYTFKAKYEAHRCSRLLHAKQFKRARASIKKLRTMLGRVIRDIQRKCAQPDEILAQMLELAKRIKRQERHTKNKIYSLHEPHVECINKGKAAKPFEFGNKVSFSVTAKDPWIIGACSFFGNPFDGATLKGAIAQSEKLTGIPTREIFVDKGYRGKVHHPLGKHVLISGQKRLAPVLKKFLKRRSSIEPVIGHVKYDHRMRRNLLKGIIGDKINPILAAAAFNFRKILRSFFVLILQLLKIDPEHCQFAYPLLTAS